MPRADFPAGTVTFLFTDVEGSTRLLQKVGAEAYAAALAEHRRVIRDASAQHGGVEVDTQGDAFFVAFPTAPAAVAAARAITDALNTGSMKVRAGLHTGTPLLTDEGYVGPDVHRAARIAAAAHGGQILLSASCAALVQTELRDLGEHRFKDLAASERVFQLGDAAFPPIRSLSRTNLPVPATPFLGREDELGDVIDLLHQTDVRLLTLTGPGGTGKTRLALQAAAEVTDHYPDGAWWVPLSAIRAPAAFSAQIAQAVGAANGLADYIADKRMLIVLDNLEHLLSSATEIATLLRACPNLKVLATSREVLQLQGEHAYAVAPLNDEDGSRLFQVRAAAATGEPAADGPLVSELCRRLDNLPLAIELAAARTRHLTLDQLLHRLSERLDLLKGGRDLDPRQQTLRATIDWSYELLGGTERALFARLSVFSGGWRLRAAETICAAELDDVASLVDKSLVRRTGERYSMLETIREFAAQRLAEWDETDAMRRRHLEFFTDLASSLGFTTEGIEAGARQRHDIAVAEIHNVRSAIAWSVDNDPALGLRLATRLENFWVSYSPYEAKQIFAELVARATDAPEDLRALATRCRANLDVMTGSHESGIQLYEESLEQYRELGDEQGMAIAEQRIGVNVFEAGEKERGLRLLNDSLARSKAHGFRVSEGLATGSLGVIAYRDGRIEEGLQLVERSLATAEEIGFKWWAANMRSRLAAYALELGRPDEAETHAREHLALADVMSDRRHAVQALGLLAQLATQSGDIKRAARLWGALEAEEVRGPVGQRPRMAAWDEDRERFAAIVLRHVDDEFERARAEGRGMALRDAVAYALGTES